MRCKIRHLSHRHYTTWEKVFFETAVAGSSKRSVITQYTPTNPVPLLKSVPAFTSSNLLLHSLQKQFFFCCCFWWWYYLTWMNFGNQVLWNNLLIKALVFLFLLGVYLGCVWELVKQHVFTAAEAKFYDIFFFEFIVPLGLDTLVVQISAIARAKVNNVRLYPPARGAICPRKLHQSVEMKTEWWTWSICKWGSRLKSHSTYWTTTIVNSNHHRSSMLFKQKEN